MSNAQFEKLIKDIPSIEVSLNWSHHEGQGSFDKEFESDRFIVFTSFGCFETGSFDAGDTYTPPSYSSNGLYVYDIEANIYDQEGEKIKLSTEQEEKLSKEIESSIISN